MSAVLAPWACPSAGGQDSPLSLTPTTGAGRLPRTPAEQLHVLASSQLRPSGQARALPSLLQSHVNNVAREEKLVPGPESSRMLVIAQWERP